MSSYYGRPILKAPVWTWEIPWYAFVGGLAGASACLAAAARRSGDAPVARVARRTALVGTVVSPVLLISDLGRPERFHHMLRVIKPTSPMSMGTWILTCFGPAAVASAALAELGWLPRLQRTTEAVAAVFGSAMATYTAVLFADTAIPVWHEARHELPAVFAGSAAASAAAVAAMTTPPEAASGARKLLVGAAALELGAVEIMHHRLGELAGPYTMAGQPARLATAARALTATGAALAGLLGRRRAAAVAGGALVLAGSACQRWAVFTAGRASAADPRYVVDPQRARISR